MDYPGKELEIFDTAKVFQKYVYFLIKKYFKDKIFEVGAGLGSFTRNCCALYKEVYLNDLDKNNFYNFFRLGT